MCGLRRGARGHAIGHGRLDGRAGQEPLRGELSEKKHIRTYFVTGVTPWGCLSCASTALTNTHVFFFFLCFGRDGGGRGRGGMCKKPPQNRRLFNRCLSRVWRTPPSTSSASHGAMSLGNVCAFESVSRRGPPNSTWRKKSWRPKSNRAGPKPTETNRHPTRKRADRTKRNRQVQTEREKVTYEKKSAEENRVFRCVFVKKPDA